MTSFNPPPQWVNPWLSYMQAVREELNTFASYSLNPNIPLLLHIIQSPPCPI